MRIPVSSKGQVAHWAEVDDADYDRLVVFSWKLLIPPHSDLRYAVRTEQDNGHQRAVLMHRQILSVEKGTEVDHIDRDGLNNRRGNLRLATHALNMQNRRATSGESAFRGVTWEPQKKLWRARGQLGGRRYSIGRFKSEADANAAVIEWRRQNMPFAVEAA